MQKQPLTISDVAEALGMSKTTVSRAISGKGRISAETRARVQAYIQKHNYRPNAVARSLAQNRTYNIALVISSHFSNFDLPFVRKSMNAVCEAATQSEYDVLLTFGDSHNTTALRRLLDKSKIDGAILTSAVENSPLTALLAERGTPFVVLGALRDKSILQVDNDQVGGCCDLIAHLLRSGIRRVALLGGTERYTVNTSRREGYLQAYAQMDLTAPQELVFMELETVELQMAAVEEALRRGAQCLACADDELSVRVLKHLNNKGVRVPQDIRLASLYGSEVLEESHPPITAVEFDAEQLARTAFQLLLHKIQGRPADSRVERGYELKVRESTR